MKRRFIDLSQERKPGLGQLPLNPDPALVKLLELLSPKINYTDQKS